jgi:hypothetical protein
MNTAEDVRHMSADIKMNAVRVLCIQLGFLIFAIKGTDGVPGCSDTSKGFNLDFYFFLT